MEGITNDQAHRLAEEALAKSKAEDHIKFQNTLYQINAGIKTYAEKGYKVFEETLSGSKFDYVEVDRLWDWVYIWGGLEGVAWFVGCNFWWKFFVGKRV